MSSTSMDKSSLHISKHSKQILQKSSQEFDFVPKKRTRVLKVVMEDPEADNTIVKLVHLKTFKNVNRAIRKMNDLKT